MYGNPSYSTSIGTISSALLPLTCLFASSNLSCYIFKPLHLPNLRRCPSTVLPFSLFLLYSPVFPSVISGLLPFHLSFLPHLLFSKYESSALFSHVRHSSLLLPNFSVDSINTVEHFIECSTLVTNADSTIKFPTHPMCDYH